MIFLQIGGAIAVLWIAFLVSKYFPVASPLNATAVITDYKRFNPTAEIKELLLSASGDAVLIPLSSPRGQCGLVTLLGNKLVSRTLDATTPLDTNATNDMLTLNSGDFTQPPVVLTFSTDDMDKALLTIQSLAQHEDSTNGS